MGLELGLGVVLVVASYAAVLRYLVAAEAPLGWPAAWVLIASPLVVGALLGHTIYRPGDFLRVLVDILDAADSRRAARRLRE